MTLAPAQSSQQQVLVGLIGSAIQASLTPALHMKEGKEQGLNYRYELFDLDRIAGGPLALTSLLRSAQEQGYAGVNITHPCKQTVLPLLDELSPDVRALGAVNTVVYSQGRKIGHNTDWWGFAESFKLGLRGARSQRVVQLGAGGAGAAVGYAMLKLGAARLDIFDVDAAQMNTLVATLQPLFPAQQVQPISDLSAVMAQADGLVHATTTGMVEESGPAAAGAPPATAALGGRNRLLPDRNGAAEVGARSAAARWTAAGWRSIRLSAHSSSSPASRRTRSAWRGTSICSRAGRGPCGDGVGRVNRLRRPGSRSGRPAKCRECSRR